MPHTKAETVDAPPAVLIELPASAGPPAGEPVRIDIPIVVSSTARCLPQSSGEIVVCATDPEAYRIHSLDPTDEGEPTKAEVKLAEGVIAGVKVEAGNLGGQMSKRAMASIKIEF